MKELQKSILKKSARPCKKMRWNKQRESLSLLYTVSKNSHLITSINFSMRNDIYTTIL